MFAALRARSEPQYEELPVIKALMAAAVAHAKQRGADALGLRTLLHHLLIAEPPALITKLLAGYAVSPDPEALQEREPQSGTPHCAGCTRSKRTSSTPPAAQRATGGVLPTRAISAP